MVYGFLFGPGKFPGIIVVITLTFIYAKGFQLNSQNVTIKSKFYPKLTLNQFYSSIIYVTDVIDNSH